VTDTAKDEGSAVAKPRAKHEAASPATTRPTAADTGSEESPSVESTEGVTFGDDEFSIPDLVARPDLVIAHVPEELRRSVDPTLIPVALRRDDSERSYWTPEAAGTALTNLLTHQPE
jgi:hypothetical protein